MSALTTGPLSIKTKRKKFEEFSDYLVFYFFNKNHKPCMIQGMEWPRFVVLEVKSKDGF